MAPPENLSNMMQPRIVLTESRYIMVPRGESGDWFRIDKKTGEVVVVHVGVGPKTIGTVGKAMDIVNATYDIPEFNEVKMAAIKSIVYAINKLEITLEKDTKPIENKA